MTSDWPFREAEGDLLLPLVIHQLLLKLKPKKTPAPFGTEVSCSSIFPL